MPLCDDKETDLQSSNVAGACLTLRESKDTIINYFVLKLTFIQNHMNLLKHRQ